MLVPLTRQKFEQIIPLIATGPQYSYYWGNSQKLLQRLSISLVAVVVIWLASKFVGPSGQSLKLILAIFAGLYWFWGPIYWASLRNAACRKYPYSGFLRGRVLDVFITEEIISEEETVNNRGELVVLENRERRINLEIGDESGFQTIVQSPLRRIHKSINPGQIAELVILSKQPNLSQIAKITDVYLPQLNLWIGEYPYLQRDVFAQVSRDLGGAPSASFRSHRRNGGYVKRRKRYQ